MAEHILTDLPTTWRKRAKFLRDFGSDEQAARLWEIAAGELDQALRVFQAGSLNLVEAAKESGFSRDHLGELVRLGQIPNAGRKNAPRIRRADLPIKASKPEPLRSNGRKHEEIGQIAANTLLRRAHVES
jgi:hypothetical protein